MNRNFTKIFVRLIVIISCTCEITQGALGQTDATIVGKPTVKRHDKQLKKFCDEHNGKFVNKVTCSKTGKFREGKFCLYSGQDKVVQFSNGCTNGPSNLKSLFFDACVMHDGCYHHEPATSGRSQEQCDDMFLRLMVKKCIKLDKKIRRCLAAAITFHQAVEKFGKTSWDCSNRKAKWFPGGFDLTGR